MQAPVKALIADQYFLTAAGLSGLLQREIGIATVLQVTDFEQMCGVLAADKQIGLLLVDLSLPGLEKLAGIELTRSRYAALKIVIVSDESDTAVILRALAIGVHGYISTDLHESAMIDALKGIIQDRIFIPPLHYEPVLLNKIELSNRVNHNEAPLTLRQREVVLHMRKGCSNKQIARALDITESTVKVHMAAAFRQLGVHNRVEVLAVLDARLDE